jgi:hypothetical protein
LWAGYEMDLVRGFLEMSCKHYLMLAPSDFNAAVVSDRKYPKVYIGFDNI